MNDKYIRMMKNLAALLAMPAVVYIFFKAVCLTAGVNNFGVGSDLRNMILNTIFTGLIALALSCNLTSGRFDFSIGSVLILSTIAGAMYVKANDLGPWAMLMVIVLVGAALGLFSGVIYVTLRVPPMIISIGIAMIYEAISYTISGGSGAKLIGRGDLLIYAKQPNNILLILVVLCILVYISKYTQYGFDTNALRTGQQIAVNVGINEKKNAVVSYIISGALLGTAGAIYISQYGAIAPETGLGSASFLMGAFLPMFIGGALSKYADQNIGVIIGAFVQATITAGFAKLGLSSSLQSVLNSIIVMVFLVYTSNSYKLVEMQMFKEKLARAKAVAREN